MPSSLFLRLRLTDLENFFTNGIITLFSLELSSLDTLNLCVNIENFLFES